MKVMTKLLLNVFLLVFINIVSEAFSIRIQYTYPQCVDDCKKTMSKVQNIRIYWKKEHSIHGLSISLPVSIVPSSVVFQTACVQKKKKKRVNVCESMPPPPRGLLYIM